MDSLAAISSQLAGTVSRAAQSVVTVHGRPRVTSSGVIWAPGLVVTAAHTLAREEGIHLTLPDGSRAEAKLRGKDAATDIALLEYEGTHSPFPRTPVTEFAPGSLLLAIGRNADTGPTASLGILSAAGGTWRTWRGGELDRFLRLDLSLFPGSSGGVVVDTEGRLYGIASNGLSRLSPLAIPLSTIERVVKDLADKGRVSRGYLGVGFQPVQLPSGQGLIVLHVESGSAADKAELLVGDVITGLDSHKVAEIEDVQAFLAAKKAGDKVTARIVRGGQNIELAVELGERK